MLTIDENNNIYLSRGNNATIELTVKQGEETYDYSDDEVVFAVKKFPSDRETVIEKTFDAEGKVYLVPEDTAELGFGDYKYDVTLKHTEEDESVSVQTVIIPHTFTVGAVIGEQEGE